MKLRKMEKKLNTQVKEMTWDHHLNEHWRQFQLACHAMNFEDKMPYHEWREYVLYDLCKRHNSECVLRGEKEYFKFEEEVSDEGMD